MSDKPNFGNFFKVNLQAFNFYYMPDGLVYKNKKTGQLYKEVDALKNRLKIEIPFAIFSVLLYILSLITKSQLRIWEYNIYIIIVFLLSVNFLYFLFFRFFFTKFEGINEAEEAAGTGYKPIELALVILPPIILILI